MCLVLALSAFAALAGCGGGGDGGDGGGGGTAQEPATPAPIGPIPAAEFATVPPPTFNQVITAYRSVTTANPALLNDEPALSRALFDEVRRLTAGGTAGAHAVARAQPTVGRLALFNLDSRLTLEEWKVVIRSPIASAQAAATIEPSAQAAIGRMPCDADVGYADGKADALRHAWWSALMTRRTGAAFAETFATAHETGSTNSAAASAMDLHNNAVGRALAERYAAASEPQLLVLLQQQAYRFVPAASAIPAGWPGLVTIAEAARRPFDGTFNGSFTMPDAGPGAWALELHLAQCGSVLGGHLRAVRSGVAIERRFDGRLESAAAMTLVFADPFPFESAAGATPCLGMQAALSGNERDLSGSWSSAGCPQGGIIAVRR